MRRCYSARHLGNVSDGEHPVWAVHICDTEGELPVTWVNEGDLAYSKDTDKWWKYTSVWSALVSGGPGGGAAWGEITGTLSNQTDLQTALNGKAALSHGHVISDVTSLQSALDSKSDIGHVHAGLPQRVIKSADQSVTSTSLTNVNDLAFALLANTSYYFRFVLYFTTAATTTGLCLAINGPASPTFLRCSFMIPTSTIAWVQSVVTAYETQLVAANSGGATALCALVEGHVQNGANAGTLTLRFRTEVLNSTVTILRGSSGLLY